MSVTKIKPAKIEDFNSPSKTPAFTLVGAEGMEIDFGGKDYDILIMVDTAEATVKAGNSLQGVNDLKVPAGSCVVLDSGCFKNVKGIHKGCVFIEGASAKAAAIELP